MKNFFLTCVAILFISSQLYAQGEDELIAKFNETNKKFSQMMVDNDLEGMLSYYAENPISMPSYQPMLRGLDAMRESHKQQHEMGMKITAFELTATDVILEGNIAVEIGTYTISMDMPEMGSMDDHGKYMTVWEKQDDGSMKIKADTWNTDMNPWEMMQEGEHGDYGMNEEPVKEDILFDRLGGEEGISAIVEDLIDAHLNNPAIKNRFTYLTENPEHFELFKQNVKDFFGAGTGGNVTYKGKDMQNAHKGMQLSGMEFIDVISDIMMVLQQHEIDEESRKDVLYILYSFKDQIIAQ
ncbi:MAG: DUF4440 domain-containing protein [Bacteroidetes bacterium]|nr:DUF4440 domain-containing protein [Bacteroidota bacterium]